MISSTPEGSDTLVTVPLWLPIKGADPRKVETTATTLLKKPPLRQRAFVSWQAVHSEIRFDDELLACRVLLQFRGVFPDCASST